MLLSVACALAAGTAGTSSARQLEAGADVFARGLRLLDAAYPDLLKAASYVRLGASVSADTPWVRNFGIRVGDNAADFQRETNDNAALYSVLLETTFAFDSRGMKYYVAHGRIPNDPENAAFCQVLARRMEWSDPQIGQELKRRGALYPPSKKEELSRQLLPPYVLASVADVASLELSSVRFVVTRPKEVGAPSPPSLGCAEWEVIYRHTGANSAFEYFVYVDPFKGRLRMVSREDSVDYQ